MPNLCEASRCTGCNACAAICPKQCIAMLPDDEGFLRPVVDETQCIACEKCSSVCPVLHPADVSARQTEAFAAQNSDEGVRANSTSGGVFTLLAKSVLDRGGVVFGAAYDEQYRVVHRRVDDAKKLPALRVAKYAQSDLGDTFRQVKSLLAEGRPVLYSGTPCQIAGLRSFLGGEPENLLLVDLVCHGVPSPAVWQQYLLQCSVKNGDGALPLSVDLRCKTSGWSTYSVKMNWPNGTELCRKNTDDPFIRSFVADLSLRPSCFDCVCKGLQRPADFTLGDYWGVWDQLPKLSDGKGTSIVLVHTEKAKALWSSLSGQMRVQQVDAQQCMAQNPAALVSAKPAGEKRDAFFSRLAAEEDFEALTLELLPKPSAVSQLAHKVGSKLKRLIRSR